MNTILKTILKSEKQQKRDFLAECLAISRLEYEQYHDQLIEAFNFNFFQIQTINTLCDLAQEYAYYDTLAKQAGISIDEVFAVLEEREAVA